ncbi:MAG TPA: DUF1684 domain-containing protein [Polyangia bacterium]|nr:DUF1684 domain-containing protein [Polyangia bacterium]
MWKLAAALLVLAATAGTDDYQREIETWRQARETRLRGDEGWLTVAGLFWLKEGENRFGSDPGGEVVLPAHSAPARAGILRLTKGKVTVEPAAGVPVTLGGKPVGKAELRSDVPGPADVVSLGRTRFFVIERSGKLAIRLRDLDSPARKSFTGLRWFPVRKEYRVVGKFTPHSAPKKLSIPNVLGLVEEMVSPGYVTFQLQGKELRLEPVYETPAEDELFFIFRDKTSAHETYGAGRFFYAEKPRNGEVIIDFNKAYTPPCAFTRFATCPLPPRQNQLPVRIEAGELDYGHH